MTDTKIECRGVDITEHVARMYDALVGSMEWGSGFLATEDVESILIVAELAGFNMPESAGGDPPLKPGMDPVRHTADRHRIALAQWRAQIKAKAQAMLQDGEPDEPRQSR